MIIGYAKASADHQNVQSQLKALKKIGCEKIYRDKQDSFKNRPELERMIRQLQNGDMVVVWKLDRIGKSLKDLVSLIELFKDTEVDFVSLQDNINTTTIQGRMFYNLMASLSKFEKDLNMGRSIVDQDAAGKRHRRGGRPKGLSNDSMIKARKAKQLYEDVSTPVAEIAKSLGIGKTTLYRYLHFIDSDVVHKKDTGLAMSNENKEKNNIRKELFGKLLESKAFWSYSNIRYKKIPDDILIQKVIEELDIDDIKKLFILYNKNHVRRVWKNKMVVQDPYYRSLNILLAKLFFNIKKPEQYIRNVQKELQNFLSES